MARTTIRNALTFIVLAVFFAATAPMACAAVQQVQTGLAGLQSHYHNAHC